MKLVWLAALIAGGAWWVRRDMASYRSSAALDDSNARQRVYFGWILQSFVLLTGAAIVTLWLAGGLTPFETFPAAFDPVHLALRSTDAPPTGERAVRMGIGMAIGVSIAIFFQWRRLKKMLRPVPGPADALIPRNRRETLLALALSINAGFSEELLFRLALPLLLFGLTGSLEIAFGLATILFGLAHAYQGWKGVLATMAAGGVLTLIYLTQGSLLRVMILHALVDIIALIVRPAILRWLARRRAAAGGAGVVAS